MDEDVIEILQKTKMVLRERGRTVGRFESGYGGPVCLVGALRIAVGGDPQNTPPHSDFPSYRSALRSLHRVRRLTNFNDAQPSTPEGDDRVFRRIDKTIKRLQKEK